LAAVIFPFFGNHFLGIIGNEKMMVLKENLQKPILICGMHRSGTSLITQMLNVCGLYLGEESKLMKAHSVDNPTGFWEYTEIIDFSDELFRKLGGAWDNPDPFHNKSWLMNINLEDEHQKVLEILKPIMKPGQIWGWKDPRATVMLPFWKTVFPKVKLIICLRNPLEVAISLSKRLNGHVDYEQGLKLWQDYHEILLRDYEGMELIVVHYETLLYKPKNELVRLCNFLNLSPSIVEFERAIKQIRTELYRSAVLSELLNNNKNITPGLINIYQRLTEKAGENFRILMNFKENSDNQCKNILERVIRTSTDTFDHNFRLIRSLRNNIMGKNQAINKLNMKVNDYEKSFNQLHMLSGYLPKEFLICVLSKIWRFTKPFRRIKILFKRQK